MRDISLRRFEHLPLSLDGRGKGEGDSSSLQIHHLGRVPYTEAYALQQRLCDEQLAEQVPDTLLLLEHMPVITLGRAFQPEHLLTDEASLAKQGIELIRTDRGGSATYHGPGQLVAYAILDLQARRLDLHSYLRLLEETMLRTLADYGIAGSRDARNAGVWVNGAKIGCIGLHVRRWVTIHGCALNVEPDLRPFELMLPCGLEGVGATSMAQLLGHSVGVDEVRPRFAMHFAELLDAKTEKAQASPDRVPV